VQQLEQVVAQDKFCASDKVRIQHRETVHRLVHAFKLEVDSIRLDFRNEASVAIDDLANEHLAVRKEELQSLANRFVRGMQRFQTQRRDQEQRLVTLMFPEQKERIQELFATQDGSGLTFRQVLEAAQDRHSAEETIRVIEQRHVDIRNLEASVLEIQELASQLTILVDQQSETIHVIEQKIDNTGNKAAIAAVALAEAEVYQKKARKRQMCCCLLIVCVLAALCTTLLVVLRP